jgi:hypothetical protein
MNSCLLRFWVCECTSFYYIMRDCVFSKHSWKTTCLISWPTCHSLVIRRELHFKHDGAHAYLFSLVAGTWNESFLDDGQVEVDQLITWLRTIGFLPVGPFKIVGVFISSGWCEKSPKSNCDRFFRQYTTCQEFGIVFQRQWNVKLRTVLRQEVDIWNIYCKVMRRAEWHRP